MEVTCLKFRIERFSKGKVSNPQFCASRIPQCTDFLYRVFLRDVTAPILVSLNKGTVAMLASPASYQGIKLYCYGKVFFGLKTMLIDHASVNTLFYAL